MITFLQFDTKETARELCHLILSHVFSLRNSAKYTMIIRRILNKLIARIGLQTVLACTDRNHHKLVSYIERARRKIKNAKARQNFASTQEGAAATQALGGADSEGEDSDADLDVSDDEVQAQTAGDSKMQGEESSDEDDSDDDDSDDERRAGVDHL